MGRKKKKKAKKTSLRKPAPVKSKLPPGISRQALEAEFNRGVAYHQAGDLPRADAVYKSILGIVPDHPGALHCMGYLAYQVGNALMAIDLMSRSIQEDPRNSFYHNNLGNVLKDLGRLNEAIESYRTAIGLDPKLAGAYHNMGDAHRDLKNSDEAMACYEQALKIEPHLPEALNSLFHEYQRTCSWQNLDILSAKLDQATKRTLDQGIKAAADPLVSLMKTADPVQNLLIAKSWSDEITKRVSGLKMPFNFDSRCDPNKRIRIGYLSADFRDHPVAHLINGLFRLHDRDEFRVYCYSYGPDDGSSYRKRIAEDCDVFVDVGVLDHRGTARLIYENGIDILVDLMGHTKGSRLDISALRPAPIQVTYLGFLGTSGSDLFDYIITDRIVTPEAHAKYYTEKFVYMPDCYQVNDDSQPISDKLYSRGDFGLPEDSFVFCSFNTTYKIEPVMFAVWMDILYQIDRSVLWLPYENETAERNMRQEAEKKNVAPERLIFSEKLPLEEHLARLRLADLALDTRIYNGGATTSNALWAGTPVVTLQGDHFVSRMSSSSLTAVGLPDLVAHDLHQYATLAVKLARKPTDLEAIRRKLNRNVRQMPLFDTPKFIRYLEKGFGEMCAVFAAGEKPRQIDILNE